METFADTSAFNAGNGACGNFYGNLHWSLEKKKAKLNIMQK
jgi:hypothetical protein